MNEERTNIDKKVNDFKEFLLFCKERIGLKKLPKIRWYSDKDNVGNGQPTFGSFHNEDQTIHLVIIDRHPLDIMRTLAHELCHYKQFLNNELNNDSGATGSPQENEANAEAGIIMRDWGKKRRDMFNDSPVEPLSESANESIPPEVHEFIDSLSSEDVGKERISDYVVHYEGFSEMCQADAEERTQLPPSDPKHLATYDDIYREVLNDFKEREGGNDPVDYGLAGDELYPVFYAVFHKPALAEADLNRINQYHEDGGSLEGYVVDTDQPQLENYLTSQGASTELIDAIKHRYHRIAIIRNMWVDEELRGGGIGTDLLGQAIGDAFAFGAEAIVLVADMAESNLMALDKWYEGFGFKTIGTAGRDPVMVLDRSLTESWSKKYKKSIDCSHPKGFSQRAHCAGRRARQAGQSTKSKSVSENFADGKGPGRPGDSQRHGIPKGATIAQLEKAAKAPSRKGQLARWQLNMRRGRAKNESVVNEGITVYHSSPTGTISKFNPFSHFGTEKAAADRIKFLIKQKKLKPDTPVTVYQIDLNIHKPAMIKDQAVQHCATQYAFALKDAKIFTQEEMLSITRNSPQPYSPEAYEKCEKENIEKLAQMLKEKGYDGLAYKNKHEDRGHTSYVILDPSQAKIVGKETIPAKDLVAKTTIAETAYLSESHADDVIDVIKSIRDNPNVTSIWTKHEKINNEIQTDIYVGVNSDLSSVESSKTVLSLKDNFPNTNRIKFVIEVTSQSRARSRLEKLGYKIVYKKSTGQEPRPEYEIYKNVMPDGELKISKHFSERVGERLLDKKWLLDNIKKVVLRYRDRLISYRDKSFIIQDEYAGQVMSKVERPDGTILYIAKTTYPGKKIRHGHDQPVLWVGKPQVAENSKLDEPTPTVGELAEKYHTSLLAVKQQLVRGIRVEMEHTTKKSVAKEIALDHLGEDLYYYKKLAKVEKK